MRTGRRIDEPAPETPHLGDCIPIREHFEALMAAQATAAAVARAAEETLREAERRFAEERDRRYAEVAAERDRRMAEVALEREKALKIKETADLAALQLAREIQTYKDEKANELREQISSERGLYATKEDVTNAVEKLEAMVKPLADYIAVQQGRSGGYSSSWAFLVSAVLVVGAVVAMLVKL